MFWGVGTDMKKDIVEVYDLPMKAKEITKDNLGTTFKYNLGISFVEIAESFAKAQDEEVFKWLYEKYKDTDVSKVYVLSKADFEEFLLEMLPKWKRKRS